MGMDNFCSPKVIGRRDIKRETSRHQVTKNFHEENSNHGGGGQGVEEAVVEAIADTHMQG